MAVNGSRGIVAGAEPAHRSRKVAAVTGGLAHDVSILPGVGRHLGSQPRANTSVTIMRARRRDDVEECAGDRDVLGAVGVGKEPVVADAVEALGQHVHQEAPDELVRVKPHSLPAARAVDAVVLPAERNGAVVGGNEAAVRDGDPMGVTGEIAQHLLGRRERRLAIDHPLDAPQRRDERNFLLSASPAWVLKNVSWLASCA